MKTPNNNNNNNNDNDNDNRQNPGKKTVKNTYGETIRSQAQEKPQAENSQAKDPRMEEKERVPRPRRKKPLIADVDKPAEEAMPADQAVSEKTAPRRSSRNRQNAPAQTKEEGTVTRAPKKDALASQGKEAGTVTRDPQKEAAGQSKETGTVTRAPRRDPSSRTHSSRGPAQKGPRPESVHFTTYNSNDKDIIRIMPLGGLDEIGKNMTAIEYRDEIIVIDCGVKFPESEMLGIDLVIPDISFLLKNQDKVKGIFITHGHEDHIGALPYILKQLNVPVYATRLTLGLVEVKLREHNIFDKVTLNIVKPRDIIKFNNVSVEFIKTNHSIADACALAVHTPAGVLVHTGDFKIDLTPVDGDVIDLARFAQLGQEGVIALMADSTNAERPGYTNSESTIGVNFEHIFAKAKGRILVATFSSNIHRLQQAIEAAIKLGRKCVFNGRSMENVVNVARELGYLDIDEKHIVSMDDLRRFRDDQLVIMTTGSQGEPMAALSRMAMGEHRKMQIQPGDTVILSSHPIPGNEKSVSRTINLLYKLGANVINDSTEDVHVSGHACQEELKLMQALVKPKYFIPVHGEYRHLKIHSELAQTMGLDSKNILIPELGDIIEVSRSGIRKNGKVQTGQVLVDGLGVGDVGSIVLRDRKHLSEDGILTVVTTVDSQSGTVIAGPDIISRGFVFIKEAEQLMEDARLMVKKILLDAEGPKMQNTEYVKNQIREDLKNFLFQRTKRKPMIMPIIMEI